MFRESLFDRLSSHTRGETRQFLILTRHFFNRFFVNDIVSFEEQAKEKFIAGIALVAGLCGFIAHTILLKYAFVPDTGQSWLDKCFFLFLGMLLMGFFTVVEWDVIFPDRRDYMNLTSLPLRIRTLVLSKFGSLLCFTIFITAGINFFALFSFLFHLPPWRSESVAVMALYAVAHLVSSFAANFFIFFVFIFVQGLLMAVLGPSIFRRISLLIRFLLLTVFVLLLLLCLDQSSSLFGSFDTLPALKDKNAAFLYAFPPMWFTGLYETILGTGDPIFHHLALYAAMGLIVPVLAFFGVSTLSYFRNLRTAWDVSRPSLFARSLKIRASSAFNAVFLRNPTQRAIFSFFSKSLFRSQIHKVRLIGYLAVAMALCFLMTASKIAAETSLSVFNRTLLSLPLVFSFFLLAGVRSVVNVPVAPEARWIFQLTEHPEKKHNFIGFRKAVFVMILLPLAAIFFILSFFLWSWRDAAFHGFYILSVATLFMHVLFFRFPKIPFACSYLPGKGKVHILWLAYFGAFLLYVGLLSGIEKELFLNPQDAFLFFGILMSIVAGLKFYGDLIFAPKTEILYDDEPEPVMVTM